MCCGLPIKTEILDVLEFRYSFLVSKITRVIFMAKRKRQLQFTKQSRKETSNWKEGKSTSVKVGKPKNYNQKMR